MGGGTSKDTKKERPSYPAQKGEIEKIGLRAAPGKNLAREEPSNEGPRRREKEGTSGKERAK